MKTFENMFKIELEIELEGSKIEENRRLEAFWKVLECLGASWEVWRDFE